MYCPLWAERERERARETEHFNKANVALKTWVDEIMCECLSVWEHVPACNNLLLPLNQAWAWRMLCKNTFSHKLKQKSVTLNNIWKLQMENYQVRDSYIYIFFLQLFLKCKHDTVPRSSQKGCYGNQLKCSSFTISCLIFFITFWGCLINIQGCVSTPEKWKLTNNISLISQ